MLARNADQLRTVMLDLVLTASQLAARPRAPGSERNKRRDFDR